MNVDEPSIYFPPKKRCGGPGIFKIHENAIVDGDDGGVGHGDDGGDELEGN